MVEQEFKRLEEIVRENVTPKEFAINKTKLAQYYYEIKDFTKAIASYKDIKESDDKTIFSFAQVNIGNLYLQMNELDKAIECWENALSMGSHFIGREQIQSNLGGMYFKKKNFKKALKIPESINISKSYQDTQDLINFNIGFVYYHNGNKDKAIKKWEEISEFYKNNNLDNLMSFRIYVHIQVYLYLYYENNKKYVTNLKKIKNLFEEFISQDYIVNLLAKAINTDYFNHILDIASNVILIKEELTVNLTLDDDERKLAHYTSTDVLNKLLTDEQSGFRLNNIFNMNDPTEGQILNDFLQIESDGGAENNISSTFKKMEYTPFIACFTFNHDNLNQFRLYGKSDNKEATGVSIVFSDEFFGIDLGLSSAINYLPDNQQDIEPKYRPKTNTDIHPVYRCVYIDPKTEYLSLAKRKKYTFYREHKYYDKKDVKEIEEMWCEYLNKISDKEINVIGYLKNIRKTTKQILNLTDSKDNNTNNLLHLSLLPIRFLIKHVAFEEEQECRICYISSLVDENIIMDFSKQWLYLDYPANVKKNIKYIYVASGAKAYYPFIVKLMDGKVNQVRMSDSPFKVN